MPSLFLPQKAPVSHFLGRKFPNVEEQSESASIRLLEKKKEAKIMHQAMEHKKQASNFLSLSRHSLLG